MEQSEKTLDMIVNLCKNRGYVFPGSEIYGGLANSWDYGPLGVEFKNNVKKAWLKKFVQESDYSPVFLLVRIAELFRVPTHNALDGQRMADVKGVFVVFFQKLKRLVSRDVAFSHFNRLLALLIYGVLYCRFTMFSIINSFSHLL